MNRKTNLRSTPVLVTCVLVLSILGASGASAQDPMAELKCVISAFDKIKAYWVEKKYRGRLSYSGENDPNKFEIHMDIPPTAYTFRGGPQEKLDGLINVAFASDEALQARFRTDCTR